MPVMQAETAQEQLSVTYPISAFTMHELLNSTNMTLHGSRFQSYVLTNTLIEKTILFAFQNILLKESASLSYRLIEILMARRKYPQTKSAYIKIASDQLSADQRGFFFVVASLRNRDSSGYN